MILAFLRGGCIGLLLVSCGNHPSQVHASLTPRTWNCLDAIEGSDDRTYSECEHLLENRRDLPLTLESSFSGQFQFLTEQAAPHSSFLKLADRTRAIHRIMAAAPKTDLPKILYHPSEQAAVDRVFESFRPLSKEALAAGAEKTRRRPWAGYWYPLRKKDLFAEADAPLRKLDAWLRNQGLAEGAADAENELYQVYGAEGWEGLCDAWSYASVLTKEPVKPLLSQGVTFTVADQKAILTKIHERVDKDIYGISYEGNAQTDGTYQDIRPEAFLTLLSRVSEAGETPLLIDDDATAEVWKKPIYKFRWRTSQDPDFEMALRFKIQLDMIKQREEITNDPTSDKDLLRLFYEARIFFSRAQDGTNSIVAGEWLGDSFEEHPDAVYVPKIDGRRGSSNPVITKHLAEIVKLLFDP